MSIKCVIAKTNFPKLKLFNRGKVRDIYDLGDSLLIVSTDRVSAFDVVMPNGIPRKGEVLNKMSAFWFSQMQDIIPNHIIATDVNDFPPACWPYANEMAERSMLVKKAQPLPIECIVRGHLAGSGWKEYKETGIVCGLQLPAGIRESEMLDRPIFTPSTKAEMGTHDESISFEKACEKVGEETMLKVREISLQVYIRAHGIALERGIFIADTKMEFGLLDGKIILIDELLTPDSSRFWPRKHYEIGKSQPSLDKQFLRDYLLGLDWDQKEPAPWLPPEIIRITSEKYLEAYRMIIGKNL